MPSTAVISILCRDRIGLVTTISETVVDMGGKVSDMTASVLGKGIVCVVSNLWPDKEPPVSEIRKRINDLVIHWPPTDSVPSPIPRGTFFLFI